MQAFLVMPISDKSMASAHVAICIAYLSAICLRAFAKALSLSSGKSNWQSVRNFDSILPYLSTKLMTHLFVYPASSWHSFANALMCQSGVYLSVNIIGSYLQMTLFLPILFANFLFHIIIPFFIVLSIQKNIDIFLNTKKMVEAGPFQPLPQPCLPDT